MSVIKHLRKIVKDGEEYDLFLSTITVEALTNTPNNPIKNYDSIEILTVVKNNDGKVFEEVKNYLTRLRKKLILSSIPLALTLVALVLSVVSTSAFDFVSGLGVLIAIPGVAFAPWALYVIPKLIHKMIVGSYGAKSNSYMNAVMDDVESYGSRKTKISLSKKLNEYSMIKNFHDSSLNDVESFVDSLSDEELEDFVIKGYEHGRISNELRDAMEIVELNKNADDFLKDAAEKRLKELEDRFIELAELRVKYTNDFADFLSAKNSLLKEMEAVQARNDSSKANEELLKFLSSGSESSQASTGQENNNVEEIVFVNKNVEKQKHV